jgi:hypothetical protein
VFRNEATDYKHLAEFHQVEGIIAWEGAKFTDLLGILKEFYSKLGFGKIRFRPSFFPYTEPSLEIEVYFEERKQWMELGGAGIFRPEVSEPLSGIYPVLAWGLSLERPLMLDLGLDILHPIQPEAMDIYKLKREYGKALTFCGGIRTQDLLPRGTAGEVRDEIRRLKEYMGRGGGYILEPGITLQADVPLENLVAMIEEARRI